MATIELGDKSEEEAEQHILKSKFAIVTIHDVSPEYSNKIFRMANELERLKIFYNFAIIPYYKQKEKNDIGNNDKEFVRKILEYNQPIALHGLYHERHGSIEDFHCLNYDETKREIQKGVDIFSAIGIKSNIFVPPTWAINKETMEVLNELDFNIVETEEEILILKKNTRLHTNIMNWDHGSSEVSRIFLRINKQLYQKKVMGNTQLIRIAMHPNDPEQALADQLEMIQGLKDINYTFLWYRDIGRMFG